MTKGTADAYCEAADGDRTGWLGFLNTVRTERFEQVLALRPSLLAIATAAQG
jgi:hypothetical protein